MRRKKSIYMGGEEDRLNEIIPTHFEKFFRKNMLFLVFMIILLLLITMI